MDMKLDESLIQKAIARKLNVIIFTKNGFQMRCVIEAQDDRCLAINLVDSGKFSLVYKDAISTIQFPVGNLL